MIEITEEMIERGARAAFGKNLDRVPRHETATPRTTIRLALEAALSPPEEIPVSLPRDVTQDGLWAFHYDWSAPWTHDERHAEMARAWNAAAKLKTCREFDNWENEALSAFYGCPKPHNNWSERERLKMARALYAMARRMELKGQSAAPYGAKYCRKVCDLGVILTPNERSGRGRREGDPK